VITTLLAAVGPIPCHLVGGVLRDFILNTPSRDLDVIVERDGKDIAERIATELGARLVLLGGDRFAAFRIVATELVLDLWDRQQQSLTADLARRDFTVNSFALDLQDPVVVDPYSGLDDLAARRLRATTESSFTGDPLRVLRLARFGGQLAGFTVVPQTLELAQRAVPELENVASERIREELRLLFSHEGVDGSFRLLERLGVYPTLWTGQSPASRESTAAGTGLDRFSRSSRWLEQTASESPFRQDPFTGRMAVLFDTASRTQRRNGVDLLQEFQTAGFISKRDAQRIERLLRWQDLPLEEGPQRWLLHEMGELWPTLVCFLGARGEEPLDERQWRRVVTDLVRLAEEQGHEIFAPTPLLSGTEIQELLDIPPGPRVGEIARKLRRLQIEGGISSRGAAERTVLELGSASADPGLES
jgi:tRNA nucleotidyltransferase/poly(A) polymerase